MEAILRGAAVYFFLLVLFRITGQRSLAQITTFDLVLLLIISETTQQALLGNDFSVINAFILIATLVTIEIGLSLLKRRSARVDRLLEGRPLVLVENGVVFGDRMARSRVGVEDILSAARESQGLERMDQVKHAVLEKHGAISVIAKDER